MSGVVQYTLLLGLFILPIFFILIAWQDTLKKKKQHQRIEKILNITLMPPVTKQHSSLKIITRYNEILFGCLCVFSLILLLCNVSFSLTFIVDVLIFFFLKNLFQMIRNYRLAKLSEALPTTLDFLARNIKSGDAYFTAVERVAHADFPASAVFIPIYEALSHGSPFAETLIKAAFKINHPDFTLCMAVLIILQETGKHDTAHLTYISELLRKKITLRKKIAANSAEARLGGYLLVLIPLICFLLISLFNSSYFIPLLHTKVGYYLLIYGACSNILGLIMIKKMTQIDI